jgi:hypothetical protein
MNDFQSFPLKRNSYRSDREIVKLLLALKELREEYPPELYEPRRAQYIQQVTTQINKSGHSGKRPDWQ